ncbi:flagellar hook capping FlgD N-terminal domain-containing protein [Poseidonocella sedimentorum]|uniref:Basal-body rod modification protein FlgD n=1 Tax=Poseidonocella sedimentorum TaxID=871652 RepID=A0A1I6D5A6_9RHOB|nr:flagellar hook capping FlgD N-terminal domain-containing protein [Poseidonocella sedimentorum]SFR00600.1 flagellar basal-body rod modification protein FlgD [Poseidonocella sedimentorum]
MTDVTSATSAAATTATPSTSASGSSPAAITSDFETFLKMLTAQLQNQDPLNPVESTDYAVQLATFSSVEQQVQTNDLLTTLLQQGGYGGLSDYAHWVGMDVKSSAGVAHDGSPVALSFDPLAEGETGSLVIKNDSGMALQRIPLSSGTGAMTWQGEDDNGLPYGDGTYYFSVEVYENGVTSDVRKVMAFDEVVEVRSDSGAVELLLASGGTVSPDEVTAVRGASDGA